MKHNPIESEIRERMEPGVLSRDGFLGEDNRDIAEIVAEDRAELEAAGLTAADVADVVDEIHQALEGAMETEQVLFNGRVRARLEEAMGGIPCPFGCGHKGHKGILTVQFSGRTLTLTPLHAHLIRRHGFFQGRGSAFRLEPRTAIALVRNVRAEA